MIEILMHTAMKILQSKCIVNYLTNLVSWPDGSNTTQQCEGVPFNFLDCY